MPDILRGINQGGASTGGVKITVTTPGTAAIPAGVPSNRDVQVELWSPGGGGGEGGGAGGGANGGGPGSYVCVLVPAGVMELGGTLTIGAGGIGGTKGGAAAAAGGTTKLTIDSVDRVTVTGGAAGTAFGTDAAAAGVATVHESCTQLLTRPGTVGVEASTDSGAAGGKGGGPAGGAGGAGSTSVAAGSVGKNYGGGGGGGSKSGTIGGAGGAAKAVFTWDV